MGFLDSAKSGLKNFGNTIKRAKKAYETFKSTFSSPIEVTVPNQNSSETIRLHYNLSTPSTNPPYIFDELKLEGSNDETTNLVEKAADLSGDAKKEAKKVGDRLKSSFENLSDELKKLAANPQEELSKLVSNPSHPISAAILGALAILAAELSGFAIFAALTFVVGAVILSPLGWVAVPGILLLTFAYRDQLRGETASAVSQQLDDLDEKRETGKITDEEYRAERQRIIEDHFS